jgi:hypothetical protein
MVYHDLKYGELTSDKSIAWYQSWSALQKMTGLRRLHINLAHRQTIWDGDIEIWNRAGTEILSMVKDITAPRDFVIVLPDHRCMMDVDVGNPHCILKIPT